MRRKEPVMLDIKRLQPGDVLTERGWEITGADLVYPPNTTIKTDALGKIVNGDFNKVFRLAFRCNVGAWGGYIFPATGEAIAIQWNGVHENVANTLQLNAEELTAQHVREFNVDHSCGCAM